MTLRRRRTRPETSMEVTDGETSRDREIADQTKNVEQHYVMREDVERLARAISLLKPSLRAVVEIHLSNDRLVKEVAELAAISIPPTKSPFFRPRTILPTPRPSIPARKYRL